MKVILIINLVERKHQLHGSDASRNHDQREVVILSVAKARREGKVGFLENTKKTYIRKSPFKGLSYVGSKPRNE